MAFCDQPKNVSNLWLGSTHLIFCASPPHHQMGLVSFCASPLPTRWVWSACEQFQLCPSQLA